MALVATMLAACQPFGLGRTAGWSVRADNSSVRIDYVLRYTSSQTTVYRLLPSGSDGVVEAGQGARDPNATLAVLDPISCRVVSSVDPIPHDYTSATLSIEGTPRVAGFDPADFDALSAILAKTDTCAASDPSATPKPAPPMVAGEWLRGWEMACVEAGGGTDAFLVRGEFLDGAVDGCEAHAAEIGQGEIGTPTGISVWNPGGDMTRLGVAWSDTSCANGATVSLYPTLHGYDAHAISIGSACAPTMKPHAVVFFLTGPIDARLVHGEVERLTQ